LLLDLLDDDVGVGARREADDGGGGEHAGEEKAK